MTAKRNHVAIAFQCPRVWIRGSHSVGVLIICFVLASSYDSNAWAQEQVQQKVQQDHAESESGDQVQVEAGGGNESGDAGEEAVVVEVVVEEAQEAEGFDEQAMAALDPAIEMLAAFAAAETGLARRVCKLTPEQDQQLRQLNRAWAKKEYRELQDSPVRGMVAGIARFLGAQAAGNANANVINDPGQFKKQMEERTLEKIDEVLTAEQQELFTSEREIRAQKYAEALADVLVHSLDSKLYLTDEQMEDLQPVVKDWLGDKRLYWEFYFQNSSYVPDLPKRLLNGILTKSQMQALTTMNAYNYPADDFNFQVQMQMQAMGMELIDQ